MGQVASLIVNMFEQGFLFGFLCFGVLLTFRFFRFPRDLFGIHQSKLGIDATAPLNQWQEFERKRVPGYEELNLHDYLG